MLLGVGVMGMGTRNERAGGGHTEARLGYRAVGCAGSGCTPGTEYLPRGCGLHAMCPRARSRTHCFSRAFYGVCARTMCVGAQCAETPGACRQRTRRSSAALADAQAG